MLCNTLKKLKITRYSVRGMKRLQKKIVGRNTHKTALVEKVIQANALNLTGGIDYNKYGIQDGIGLIPCSNIFVDSFILSLLIPDSFLRGRKFRDVSEVKSMIRSTLKAHGLNKCSVRPVGIELYRKELTDYEREKMAYCTSPSNKYYLQNYKIACGDENMDVIMNFLREEIYNEGIINFMLRAFNCTIDCQGSFNKDQIILHMTNNRGFEMQGVDKKYGTDVTPGTIIENESFVGRNCLTYMTEVDGFTTICKVYNKFAQCLETKAVKANIGQPWKDWVEKEDTCLASSRDKARERGLTRVEVTFYTKESKHNIPSDGLMSRTLEYIKSNVPDHLVYSTPYPEIWKAYCECMVHTLVVVDAQERQIPQRKRKAVIVYSYNEITGKICGQEINDWDKKAQWCLANMSLGGNLPVDIIEIDYDSIVITKKSASQIEKEKKMFAKKHQEAIFPKRRLYTADYLIELSASRYFRHHKDGTTNFKTQVVSPGHSHETGQRDKSINNDTFMQAGFVPTENCIPDLSGSGKTENKRVDMIMTLQQTRPISVTGHCHLRYIGIEREKALQQFQKFDKNLENVRQEVEIVGRLKKAPLLKLSDIPLGKFPVFAVKLCGLKGSKVIIDFSGEMVCIVGNKALTQSIRDCIPMEMRQHLKIKSEGWLFCSGGGEMGELVVEGFHYTASRNKSVHCCINFHSIEDLINLNITTGVNKSKDDLSASPSSSPSSLLEQYHSCTSATMERGHMGESSNKGKKRKLSGTTDSNEGSQRTKQFH